MSTSRPDSRYFRGSSRTLSLLSLLLPALLAGCQVEGPLPLPLAARVSAVTTANGLALNGLGRNGLALNGLVLNGLALNGLALNGLALNGLSLNGLALNGLALNGMFINGLALNGLVLNGLALNGLALNGFALNGLALNNLTLDGVALATRPTAQQEAAKTLLRLLTECALPAGQCVTLTAASGSPDQACGVVGLDPGWYGGAADPTRSAQLSQCVLERGPAEGTPVSQPVLLESFKKVLRYAVECALPEEHSITITDENDRPLTLSGALGLGPEWETGALSLRGQRRVSACLAARVNTQGRTVRLSLRMPEMGPTNPVERATYHYHEGGFWGNLFGANPYLRTCAVQGSTLAGRECTAQGGCGFQVEGACAAICAAHDGLDGTYSQCRGPDDTEAELDVVNAFLPIQHQLLASFSHTCAVGEDGSLRCWGRNETGQLGDGSRTDRLEPVVVPGPTVVSVAAGRKHTCALASDSSVWCWGENTMGQLGDGTTTHHLTPSRSLMSGAVAVTAGESHTCALASDGTVWCWGRNASGQLGDGTTTIRTSPTKVALVEVVRLSLGHRYTCALTSGGSVWCWGENSAGQLGDGTTTNRPLPVRAILAEATSVSAANSHTCALKTDRSIWCWGSNAFGQLGDGSNTTRLTAVPITASGNKAAAVAVGTDYTCSVQTDGKLSCWGSQNCLSATNADAVLARKIPGIGKPGRLLVMGHHNAFVQDSDGRWLGWGCNEDGELGTGTTQSVEGGPVLLSNPACGNALKDVPQESQAACRFDFCQSCEVKESSFGSAACGACGEKLNLERSTEASCAGQPAYLVTDCEVCGALGSGPGAACGTCSACITSRSCLSCTVASCDLCGSK